MSMEPCPQCGTPWQEGQDVCSNCGFRRPPAEGRFRTGMTGIRPIPSQPEQQGAAPPPPPAAPPPPALAPPSPPGAPPPGAGYQQQQPWEAQQPAGQPAWGQPTAGSTWGAAPAATRPALQPLAIMGALIVALGTFLPWSGEKILGIGGQTVSAFDISANVLWDTTPGDLFFKIAYAFLILAGLGLLASLVPRAAGFRRIAGVLTIVAVALYAVTAIRALNDNDALSVDNVFRIIAIGAFVSLVGGILLLLSPKRRVPAG
jgi:hypothetical protein